MAWIWFFLLVLNVIAAATADNCGLCDCKWSGGRLHANCTYRGFTSVPDMNNNIREIEFSHNAFYELRSGKLASANLTNVHKLMFKNCSLRVIDKDAFQGLDMLINLDLSHNSITALDVKTFSHTSKLRSLDLSKNALKSLESGLFHNLSQFQNLYLSQNELSNLTADAFGPNSTLSNIYVSENRLTSIGGSFLKSFRRLTSMDLQKNPWVCDCHLQTFRNDSVHLNLITALTTTTCEEPERLRGVNWGVDQPIFGCVPEIVFPTPNAVVEVDTQNHTISCKVVAEPIAGVDWYFNGRIVDRDPRQSHPKYNTSKEPPVNSTVVYNLTIFNFNVRDRGEYKCVAKNPAGVSESVLTLTMSGNAAHQRPRIAGFIPWIIGSCLGVAVLVAVVIVYCCCKRNRRGVLSKNHNIGQSNEFIGLHGHSNEMEKSLITDVNPIVKPPRQYTGAPSVTSAGTEVSEAKKMLIDDESSFIGDEESRSLEFESLYAGRQLNNIHPDYRKESQYPPDLLSFPAHAITQISPAGSSASTVIDTSRLPAHNYGLQSPIHSPTYDTNGYRTLPYSRSHSPFAPFASSMGPPPVRIPRQGGYVTVPRKPRQSWSSEPPTSDIGEPLYDNLGLRTTATGSSVLSLNRLADSATSRASSAMSNRSNARAMHPLSPTLSTMACDPIAEHDSPPSATTLPRSSAAQRATTPNGNPTQSWTSRSPESVDSRRESTASLLPTSTPEGKAPKVPPRPPPKPKKRTSAGPLFEDEGEDGTEV